MNKKPELPIWTRDEIQSPCVQICVIDERNGQCLGCGRTRFEIAGWSRMSGDDRRTIMDALPERMKNAAPKRAGGRRARRG